MPNGIKITGSSYFESKIVLDELSDILREALKVGNERLLKDASISVLSWGGVTPSNKIKVEDHENYLNYIVEVINRLNPATVSLDDNFSELILNSGFTKIYSLLIEDFIIYDGRVGAAFGYLVRLFLEDLSEDTLPNVLHFYYGIEKGSTYANSRRNPSNMQYKFKRLSNNSLTHIDNNIRANWVSKHIAQNSRFAKLENPVRALESALFMIGYDVSLSRT